MKKNRAANRAADIATPILPSVGGSYRRKGRGRPEPADGVAGAEVRPAPVTADHQSEKGDTE